MNCVVCKKPCDNIIGHIECLTVIKAFEIMTQTRLDIKPAE